MIDVYPTEEELKKKYSLRFYDLNLAAMDITYYKTHADLFMEMVRQRLIQNFQLVPQAVVMASGKKATIETDSSRRRRKSSEMSIKKDYTRKQEEISPADNPKIALSMGHRLQTIQYQPDIDAVRVIAYARNDASNVAGNKVKNNYKLWLPASKTYTTAHQNFDKYPDEYNWNRLDNLICGDTHKTLTEATRYVPLSSRLYCVLIWLVTNDNTISDLPRYRRLSFRVIPDPFKDSKGEQEYVQKLHRLIEFLEKLAQVKLRIKISSSEGNCVRDENLNSSRGSNSLTRFIVQVRKTKRDKYEWMEVVVNSNVDTKRAFRISFNWLVASSIKIEAHVHLLIRRCSKYNLNLVTAATASLHSDMYLHPVSVSNLVCFLL